MKPVCCFCNSRDYREEEITDTYHSTNGPSVTITFKAMVCQGCGQSDYLTVEQSNTVSRMLEVKRKLS